jgi:hypothetical protein
MDDPMEEDEPEPPFKKTKLDSIVKEDQAQHEKQRKHFLRNQLFQ